MPDELPLTFVPTAAQWRYLRAYLEPNGAPTIRGCAARANVNWRTVYDWLADERFRDWFTAETRRVFTHQLPAMWSKCMELACAGSPEHIKLIALRTGELIGPGTNDHARPSTTAVFINVPRPRALDPEDRAALPEAQHTTTIDTQVVTPHADLA